MIAGAAAASKRSGRYEPNNGGNEPATSTGEFAADAGEADRLRRAYDELEYRIDELAAAEELDAMRPDLDGNQIMALLGVKPGRDVGRASQFLLERRMTDGPVGGERAPGEQREWWAGPHGAGSPHPRSDLDSGAEWEAPAIAVEGDGSTARIPCPSHAWVYRLDGQCVAAPYMQHTSEADGSPFDPANHRLRELPTEVWEGFVFTSQSAAPAPLAPRIAGLTDEVCLLYTSPSPRDRTRSRMPSSA